MTTEFYATKTAINQECSVILKANNVVVDLTTAASVTFYAYGEDSSVAISGAGTFVGARTTGQVQYVLTESDLATLEARDYQCVWKIVWNDDSVDYYPDPDYDILHVRGLET